MSDTTQLIEPPDELDGAKVVLWAWSGEKPFGFIPLTGATSNDPIAIHGLAICQYDDNTIYRFSCDSEWEVRQDGFYDSIEEACARLPDQYKLGAAVWHDKGKKRE